MAQFKLLSLCWTVSLVRVQFLLTLSHVLSLWLLDSAVRERFPKLLKLVGNPQCSSVGVTLLACEHTIVVTIRSECVVTFALWLNSILDVVFICLLFKQQDGHVLPPPIGFDLEVAPATLPPSKVWSIFILSSLRCLYLAFILNLFYFKHRLATSALKKSRTSSFASCNSTYSLIFIQHTSSKTKTFRSISSRICLTVQVLQHIWLRRQTAPARRLPWRGSFLPQHSLHPAKRFKVQYTFSLFCHLANHYWLVLNGTIWSFFHMVSIHLPSFSIFLSAEVV